MAIDTVQKRAAVIGIARPWYRNTYPTGSLGIETRRAIGSVFPHTVEIDFETNNYHTITLQDAYIEVKV